MRRHTALALAALAYAPRCAALQPAAGLPAEAAGVGAAGSVPPASTPPAACAGRAECEPERWLQEQQALNRVIVLARARNARDALTTPPARMRRALTANAARGRC
jgi:hypothetical protein